MKIYICVLLSFLSFNVACTETSFTPNEEANKKTITALINAGTNINRPHPLEHHFYSYDSLSILALMKKGTTLGYLSANTGEAKDDKNITYWYCDLIKDTELNIKTINEQSLIMLELAHQFNSNYDGWGTNIVE